MRVPAELPVTTIDAVRPLSWPVGTMATSAGDEVVGAGDVGGAELGWVDAGGEPATLPGLLGRGGISRPATSARQAAASAPAKAKVRRERRRRRTLVSTVGNTFAGTVAVFTSE